LISLICKEWSHYPSLVIAANLCDVSLTLESLSHLPSALVLGLPGLAGRDLASNVDLLDPVVGQDEDAFGTSLILPSGAKNTSETK